MPVVDPRTWMEHLNQDACWDFLAANSVGRLGVDVAGAPEIFPVNYAVDGHTIVFRTEPGTKLAGLDRSPWVCLEIDGLDLEASNGWSVLLKGRAQRVTSASEIERLAGVPLELWTARPKSQWVRITPTEVSGRRINPVDAPH